MTLVDDAKITSELKGNTFRVYWVLLNSKDGRIGVRELQRQLRFSSPALASYHLTKLEELGLVMKTKGNYQLKREIKVGILKHFIKVGTFILPRYTFYAVLFTTLLVFLVSQFQEVNFYSTFALILAVLGTIILWYETLLAWKQKP